MKKGNKIGRIFKSIGLGIIDSLPVASTIKSNIENELGGTGKIDYIRLGSSIAMIISLLAFIFGKIDENVFERILDLIGF